jgi:hypothetical protein
MAENVIRAGDRLSISVDENGKPDVVYVERAWQPIETAPEDAENWLLWDAEYSQPVVVQKRGDDGTFWQGDWDHLVRATHWAPLPEPPSA